MRKTLILLSHTIQAAMLRLKSHSSNTNLANLLQNTIYTAPSCFRYIFQLVQTETTTGYCKTLPIHWTSTFEISFEVFQTETTGDYSRILPTLHPFETQIMAAYYRILPTEPSRLRYLSQVVQTQNTAACCKILPTMNPTKNAEHKSFCSLRFIYGRLKCINVLSRHQQTCSTGIAFVLSHWFDLKLK